MMNEEQYPHIPNSSEEVLSRLTSTDPEHVDFSIDYARTLFRDELDRHTEVERKAALLVGATGVAAVFFTALAGFLLNFPPQLPDWSRIVVLLLFILLAGAFSRTIYFSLRVLWVGRTAYPGALSLLEGQNLDTVQYKKLHITELFVAFSNNIGETNRKVDQLVLSQRSFLVSLIVLLVTGVFIAGVSQLLP